MTIGEKIKLLRQKNDVTQEKLAEYLNITYQSISKWENNNAMPDISLVVPLANFFGVTIDELFDRNAEESEAEIQAYLDRSLALRNEGRIKENLALWREATQKYPGNYQCLIELANAVWDPICSGDDCGMTRDECGAETVAICERIVRDCTDREIVDRAIQLLVYIYGNGQLALADEEKAVQYAKKSSGLYTCAELLLEHAYYTKEGMEKVRAWKHQNNLQFMDLLCCNLTYSHDGDPILALETVLKLWHTLIYDGNFLFYHVRLRDVHQMLARLYMKADDREAALSHLEAAMEHAKKSEARTGEQNYTAAFVAKAVDDASCSTKNYTDTDTQLVRGHMEDPVYDPIRKDPRFLALLSAK